MRFIKSTGWRPCLAATLALAASPPTSADPAGAPHMKPVIAGFIDMQSITWHNTDAGLPTFTLDYVNQFPGLFGGIVLNAAWKEMQTQPGATLTTTRIDNALNQVRHYNSLHPTAPLGVKLRIFQGNQAPAWAKAINGPPLTIQRNPQGCRADDCSITIGRVWDPDYIAAWRTFQGSVAERYDGRPLIRSVAITSCAMETDEPFVMPVQQPVPPGYTDAAGQACLSGAVDDYAAWQRTAIDYTINVFMRLQQKGTDLDFSLSVIDGCRTKLAARCELGNHAFAANMPPGNAQIVAAISEKGAPIHYQTLGPKKPAFVSWSATVTAARRYNATGVELWPQQQYGGFTTLTMAQMQQLSALFNGH